MICTSSQQFPPLRRLVYWTGKKNQNNKYVQKQLVQFSRKSIITDVLNGGQRCVHTDHSVQRTNQSVPFYFLHLLLWSHKCAQEIPHKTHDKMTDSDRGLRTPTRGKCGFRGFRQASQQPASHDCFHPHFRCVRKIAKTDYWLRHVLPPLCRPHRTTRLPPDGFSPKLIFD